MTTKPPVAYRVETPRLVLRCWSPEDAPELRRALDDSDQHLRPWIPFMKDEPRNLESEVPITAYDCLQQIIPVTTA